MKTDEAEQIARTESLFREVNERIAEAAQRFDAPATQFFCECADPSCTHRIAATPAEYERVREDGATFLLVPATRTSESRQSSSTVTSTPSSRSGIRRSHRSRSRSPRVRPSPAR